MFYFFIAWSYLLKLLKFLKDVTINVWKNCLNYIVKLMPQYLKLLYSLIGSLNKTSTINNISLDNNLKSKKEKPTPKRFSNYIEILLIFKTNIPKTLLIKTWESYKSIDNIVYCVFYSMINFTYGLKAIISI